MPIPEGDQFPKFKLPSMKDRDWFFSKVYKLAFIETHEYLEARGLIFSHENEPVDLHPEPTGYSLQEVDYILSSLRRPFHSLDLKQVYDQAITTCRWLESILTTPQDPCTNLESNKITVSRVVKVLNRAKQMFQAKD